MNGRYISGSLTLKTKKEIKEIKYKSGEKLQGLVSSVEQISGFVRLTNSDMEVAEMLRRKSSKVVLCVNKIDTQKLPDDFYDFYELGLGEPVPVSAANMLNLGDLLDKLLENLPEVAAEDEEDVCKIAVIGKPNVGKSSLINRLLGEERVIVSDIAGTTRDSIDTPLEKNGEKFILIDTAGIRRKSKVYEDIEKYSHRRSEERRVGKECRSRWSPYH